jgi:hypothetical protein
MIANCSHWRREKYWRNQTIGTSFESYGENAEGARWPHLYFDLQANTLMEGCRLQHGLFFAPYRLYLHCENGIGVKRLRGCLFTAGGVREEFIGARRRAFESSLGFRMLWG